MANTEIHTPPPHAAEMAQAFRRATKNARALFGADNSVVILRGETRDFRYPDPGGQPDRDRLSGQVIETGQSCWLEDAQDHPEVGENAAQVGIRMYVAAPIVLADGSCKGSIIVVDAKPRPRDDKLLALLEDLAAGIAESWERLFAMEAQAVLMAEAESAVDTLSTLISTLPMGLVMTDRDMKILKTSPAWARAFGRKPGELVGVSLYDVSPYFRQFRDHHVRILNGESINHPRLAFERGARTEYVNTRLTPWRNAEGEVGGMLVTAVDVTELAETVNRLESAQRRLNIAVELAGLHIYEVDYRKKTLDKIGPDTFYERPVQYEDIAADPFFGLHPDDRASAREAFKRSNGSIGRERVVCRANRTDGKEVWMTSAAELVHDDNGEVTGFVGVLQNVTAAKEAERAIVAAKEEAEDSERLLKMAIELANLHVYEIDFTKRVFNKIGLDSFYGYAYTFEDLEKDLLCPIHPDDRQLAQETLSRMQNGAEIEPVECRGNCPDGAEKWMSSAAEAFRDEDGNLVRIVGAFRDITEDKKAEQALIAARDEADAANIAKSEFLANMSHEIRTPLNGVLGMAQVIEAGELSAEQRERVGVIRESGQTLLAILNDVLDLSKIQAGKFELNFAPFDMGAKVRRVAAAFEGAAAAKDVRLTTHVDPDCDGGWMGDGLRLRQVLSNLVSNALKFTENGEVRIEAHCEGAEVALSVSDTGIGIPADKIADLFEKFTQADASTTRRFGGTGLGLNISRELVALMGGRIEVVSREGEGSTFTVRIPLERCAAPVEDGAAASAAVPDRPLRILAAEDNSTNQLVLRSLLAPLDVDLTIVGDGVAAVEAFRNEAYDLVLMDVQMPRMNGVEACQTIRQMEVDEGRRRTPVLALSANVMNHQIAEYEAAGMDGHIAKPIEVEKLYAALEAAISGDQADEAAPDAAEAGVV